MKKLAYGLCLVPIAYSIVMLVKTPNISDALIVLALSALSGTVFYLKCKYDSSQEYSPELRKLEEELQIERIKANISTVKNNTLRDQLVRDRQNAGLGEEGGKRIIF